MGTNVDPNKVEELAVEFKRLSRIIEDGETSVNKDIMDLIQETNSQYTESYVRSTTSEMESLLKEIRMLAVSITERLNDKSNVLKRAAEQYRHDEEEARKLLQKPVGFSLGRSIGGAFGNFFKKIRKAFVAVVNKAIDFIFGKGKNKYREPTLDIPLDVTPLKANLIINTNVYSEEVKKLQQKLKDLGYDIKVDGYFGEQTLGVVNTYKDKYGLANTGDYNGVVDDQMWLYLFGSLSGELKLSTGMYSQEVRIAQIRLKDLGYDVEITGYFDDKTQNNVNEFKENNKLGNSGKWEGVIGPQTWGVLFGAEAMAAVVGNISSTEDKAGIAGSFNIVDDYTSGGGNKNNDEESVTEYPEIHKDPLYGDIHYRNLKDDKGNYISRVEIEPEWVAENIVDLPVPKELQDALKTKNMKTHKHAVPNWEKVFELLQDEYKDGKKYMDLIETVGGGAYSPRHIIGSSKPIPEVGLSNHSFGSAIDINIQKKEMVKIKSEDDTIREVEMQVYKQSKKNRIDVSINTHLTNYILYENVFKPAGFGWGMYYKSALPDGMHFEIKELLNK